MLQRQSGRSAAIISQVLMSIWPFFISCLAVSSNRFLWPPRVLVPCVSCTNKYLSRETVFRYSDTVASPAELVLSLPLPQYQLCRNHKRGQAGVVTGAWNHRKVMLEKQFQTNLFPI